MRRSRVPLLAILLLCGAAAYPVPVMSIDSTAYSTAIQAPGGIISHVFAVTNSGNQTLRITGVLTSCSCTTVTPQRAELAPGKSTGISVYVDTSGFAGRVERTITLQSNDPANPEVMLFISVTVAAAAQEKLSSISASDLRKRFYLLVDVRTPEEFAAGHLLGAVSVPLAELQHDLALWSQRLPRDVPIILQCKAGSRSAQAAQILLRAGFTNILNLDGGITEWTDTFGSRYLFGFPE